MKFFVYILSLYILVLIAIPCIDKPVDNTVQKIELSHNDNNHQSNSDHCSPFCSCDCCVTPVIQLDISICLDCFDYTYREYSEFSVSYTFSLFAYIWQPPKLS